MTTATTRSRGEDAHESILAGLTPIQRLLLDCLHADPTRLDRARVAALNDDGWRELFDLARLQRVRPLVLERLSKMGFKCLAPSTLLADFEKQCRLVAMKTLKQQAELRQILCAFGHAEIRVIVLKGAYLREAVYSDPAFREMNDVDVLVPMMDLERAASVVTQRGYRPMTPYDLGTVLATSKHLPRFTREGIGLEIHWNLTNPGQSNGVTPEPFWQRAVPFVLENLTAYSLSPEDLILYLAYHVSHHHEFELGLRPFCDIALASSIFNSDLDWNSLVSRAESFGWTRGVASTMALSRDLLGSPIPSSLYGQNEVEIDVQRSAVAQTFALDVDLVSLHRIARLAGSEPFEVRVRHGLSRMFLSRTAIAAHFSTSPEMSRLTLGWLHAKRVAELLHRRGASVVRLLLARLPRGANDAVQRKNRIADWLAGKDLAHH